LRTKLFSNAGFTAKLLQMLRNPTFVVQFGYFWFRPNNILGDPGADSPGERQIKRAKSVRAETWCERKFTTGAGTAPGMIP